MHLRSEQVVRGGVVGGVVLGAGDGDGAHVPPRVQGGGAPAARPLPDIVQHPAQQPGGAAGQQPAAARQRRHLRPPHAAAARGGGGTRRPQGRHRRPTPQVSPQPLSNSFRV